MSGPIFRRRVSRRTFMRLAGLVAATEVAAACSSRANLGLANPDPTLTATADPTATPSPTWTWTPSPTPTHTPTPTSTPTLTPTDTPTPTPTDTPSPTPTDTPSPTPTRGPLRAISLIHGPSRALVVDHVLKRLGVLSTQVRVDLGETVPDLRAYDGVIFAGGEYRPDEFEEPFFQVEKERIFEALEANVPILGICLGHQLLAYWLGGEVKTGRWEIGWLPVTKTESGEVDPLLAGIASPFHAFLWHGDQIMRLPEEAVLLASSEKCRVQSYRLGTRPVWGVQFNPQYDPVIAEGVIRAATSLPKYGYDLDEMVATGYSQYDDLAGKIFGNFFDLVLKGDWSDVAPTPAATPRPAPPRPPRYLEPR